MMLPIYIYQKDRQSRLALLDALDISDSRRFRIKLSTDSLEAMSRAIEAESGIATAILCVSKGEMHQCAALGNRLMQKNHASYAVFYLTDPGMLQDLLDDCMRPAGILMHPLDQHRLNACMKRILQDYEAMQQESDGRHLLIEANSVVYRLSLTQISYIEALDKLLTIHTERQNITVRHTLNAISEQLDDQFVRCHRAYLVNLRHIASVEYAQMQITLKNGEQLPMSRGQRASIRHAFEAGKGAS